MIGVMDTFVVIGFSCHYHDKKSSLLHRTPSTHSCNGEFFIKNVPMNVEFTFFIDIFLMECMLNGHSRNVCVLNEASLRTIVVSTHNRHNGMNSLQIWLITVHQSMTFTTLCIVRRFGGRPNTELHR